MDIFVFVMWCLQAGILMIDGAGVNTLSAQVHPIFGQFPISLGERLAARAASLTVRRGRTLVSLGALSDTVYIVGRGRLQVTLYSAGGREVILRTLRDGEMFGELAAIDGQRRSTSVVALADCQLFTIDAETFRAAVTEIPEGAAWLARRMAAQVRDLTERLFELNALTVRSRLHCELLRMCEAVPGGASAVIEPSPTHAQLAARVGTHREAVTRELGYLTQRGIFAQQRRQMTVVDLPALVALVRAATGDEPPGL